MEHTEVSKISHFPMISSFFSIINAKKEKKNHVLRKVSLSQFPVYTVSYPEALRKERADKRFFVAE